MLRKIFGREEWGKRNIEELLQTIKEGIAVQDKFGNIVYANTTAAYMLDLKSPKQLLKAPARQILKSIKLFDENGNALSIRDLPARKVFNNEDPDPIIVHYIIKKSRRERWAELVASPLYGNGGVVEYAVNVFRDITEQKKKEEEILFKNNLLIAQGNASTQGLLAVDKEENVLYANKKLAEILGLDYDSFNAATVKDLYQIGRKIFTDFSKFIAKASVLGKSKTRKSKGILFMKNGKIINYYSVPVVDKNNQFKARMWFFEDKTFDFKNEEHRNAFIGVVTHEIRNPLAIVRGYAEIASKKLVKKDGEKLKSYLGKILEQTDKVSELVNDLLDLTQIRSGILKLQKKQFDINALVNETLEICKKTAPHKIHKSGSAKLLVFADKTRIRQVLINLISNAIKYSPRTKAISIIVKQDKEMTQISVKDFGPGISKEDIGKIFEVYTRGERGRSNIPGFGIGLFVSKAIIKGHNGKIWVDSKLGKGSTFTFSIPNKGSKTSFAKLF
ncbi:PAS domain-containing protein [Candidatus Microgenomates bacterium]|nr:PAS domain-containing protein [Candidatus Microgenomates bacterium]